MNHPDRRILVACIGNIFLGDDGFGVEVAQRLRNHSYPQGVQVVDFGIRGMDLAYTLLETYDTLVLVDTIARGGKPGTVYLIEPDLSDAVFSQGMEAGREALNAHSMDPIKVLAFARTLGARPIHTVLVGCEPESFGDDEGVEGMWLGLSESVRLAVDEAVKVIDALVEKLLTVNDSNHPLPFKSQA